MKHKVAFLVGWLSVRALWAQAPVDPYLGDWQGTVRLEGGAEQNVAAYLIPHGEGNYEAKMVSAFDQRVPTLFQLRCRFENGGFRAVNAIPFDASHVVGTTDQGVVVRASLWSGTMAGQTLRGQVAGAQKGEFNLSPTQRPSPALGKPPPAGAVVVFDGRSLDAWTPRDPNARAVRWKLVEGGAMEVSGGDIMTREKFGDVRVHLEFRTPYMPHDRGQGRGNSGVYVAGRYEVQVLDSYGLEGEDNECGGIYQIARPAVNRCAPPLQWQTYDVTFHLAKTDAAGKKTTNARITVMHNGVIIHDNLELPRLTGGALDNRESEAGPLLLQDHGNPVRFRNIWIEKLGP